MGAASGRDSTPVGAASVGAASVGAASGRDSTPVGAASVGAASGRDSAPVGAASVGAASGRDSAPVGAASRRDLARLRSQAASEPTASLIEASKLRWAWEDMRALGSLKGQVAFARELLRL